VIINQPFSVRGHQDHRPSSGLGGEEEKQGEVLFQKAQIQLFKEKEEGQKVCSFQSFKTYNFTLLTNF
jgi:hypothetical protein